ncbi:phage antirepressor KilAC domain-containing protein [Paenibacillus polymyxa]|uniref:phage antirepressor KilAC domain-containing protein n=1 Tax=Paenibacillus polymyxa TaxID=1406 RepID=UPI002ED380A8|nr:phage antirepressor KilAC domain-containing protein [Paenibacillus polymyxa]
MSNEIKIFKHMIFGDLPVIVVNGIEKFGATEAATALCFSNPYDAIKNHIDEDDLALHEIVDSLGRRQNKKFTTESGLYSLIFGAARQGNNSEIKKIAQEYKRWVTGEVLPMIRKTGGYVANDDLFVSTYLQHADEQTKLMFRATLETVRKQNEKLMVMQPKAEFFDAVASSKDAIDIGTAAKVLKIKGVGRNNLFERLRNAGVLMANNQPYQRYVDNGYFRVIEQKYTKPDGSTNISIKTLVYQKGLDFIRRTLEKGPA